MLQISCHTALATTGPGPIAAIVDAHSMERASEARRAGVSTSDAVRDMYGSARHRPLGCTYSRRDHTCKRHTSRPCHAFVELFVVTCIVTSTHEQVREHLSDCQPSLPDD